MASLVEVPQPRLELRRAILESGLPAWKIGYLAGLTPTVLSHIATRRRAPRPAEAARLAQVLGVKVGVLFPDLEDGDP
jgi:hypothetical protein